MGFLQDGEGSRRRASAGGLQTAERRQQEFAIGFKNSRSPPSPLNGCIGAIDGIAIKIRNPHDDLNLSNFYCRKQFYALPLQALVDATYRFICCSLRCVGSTHDVLSLSISGLSRFLREGGLKPGLWIATEDAYECTESLITPFSKRRAPLVV